MGRNFSSKSLLKALAFTVSIVTFTALTITLFRALNFDADRALMAALYDFRGERSGHETFRIIALSDRDFEPPLSLSPKYKPEAALIFSALDKALSVSPRLIFIDDSLYAPELTTEDTESKKRLTESGKVNFYSETVKASARQPEDNLPTHSTDSPILVEDVTAYRFPSESALIASAKNANFLQTPKREPKFINFYGSSGTLHALTLGEFLSMPPQELESLKDKIIFFGKQSSIFLKGQIPANRYFVPAGKEKMFSPEIQATIIANLASDSYLSALSIPVYFALFIILLVVSALAAALLEYRKAVLLLVACTAAITILLYQMFASAFLWARSPALLVLLPLSSLILSSALTIYVTTKKYYEKRKTYRMD